MTFSISTFSFPLLVIGLIGKKFYECGYWEHLLVDHWDRSPTSYEIDLSRILDFEEEKEEIMSNLKVTIKDDNGIDRIIENILTFQKHLKEFNKKDPIFRWNDAVFTVDGSFCGKLDELVEGLYD